MKRFPSLLAAFGLAVMPAVAHAHFLWATLDPTAKTVAVGLREVPSDPALPLGERAAKVKAWAKPTRGLELKADGELLKASVVEPIVGVSLDYGVLDKTQEGRGVFWLKYYAKAAVAATASKVDVGLPVELSAEKKGAQWIVLVQKDGKPTANADVVVEGDDAFTGKTGADGTVAIPATSGGYLAVRALVTEQVTGQNYSLIRSYSSLTVGTPETKPESFTRILHDSFGDNHEVVSHTAFVQTLMGGKLTKAQLEVHLQQRALIHGEIDSILKTATNVPYGQAQKDVLDYLAKDLVVMGSSWPKEEVARPLTKEFLAEIKESAKQGPFFALGVMHVYYGGITNGGRFIGKKIGDTVGVTPTYYLKSDGYQDYLKLVNEIKDPAARREMIRGGQAAYKYIIASNSEDVFKG